MNFLVCSLFDLKFEGSFPRHNLLTSVMVRVRKQLVNVPSFIVRLDSSKHIDFSVKSPFGGGRPGRNKRKKLASGGNEE